MKSSDTKSADIIVIGGGVVGCSTAYNLAEQGAKNVVLLERKGICGGGTAKSCAIVRTHYSIAGWSARCGLPLKPQVAQRWKCLVVGKANSEAIRPYPHPDRSSR